MKDWLEIIDWIESKWYAALGGVMLIIASNVLVYTLMGNQSWWNLVSASWILTVLSGASFIFWLVSTRRAFQRTRNYVLIWYFVIIAVAAVFNFVVYPYGIQNSAVDFAFVRYWGTGIVLTLLFLIYYLVDFKWYKHTGGVLIMFLVENSSNADKQIKDSLREACDQIEDSCNSITLLVAPFGIVRGKRGAKRLIKSLFCQVDAIIYSRVMDGNEDGNEGYVFTEFCSFANSSHFSSDNARINDIDNILAVESQYENWNICNEHNDDVTSKLRVAKSIEQLIRLYSTCIYILKHRLSTAIEMAQALYDVGSHENVRLRVLAHNLLEFAYLEAEYVEEQEHKDYNYALSLLNELSSAVPFISRTLSYELAMARVHFHLNCLNESKRYTKQVKEKDPWGYAVNMAFYAMYEGQVGKFVTHYKRLPKLPAPTRDNVEFVIGFLQDQIANTTDRGYEMLLLSAIAFQTQYLDFRKAKSRAKIIMSLYCVADINSDLKKFLDAIINNNADFSLKDLRNGKR